MCGWWIRPGSVDLHEGAAPWGVLGHYFARVLISSDSGGTFTDLVVDDGRVVKVPSTPDDPARAVRTGVAALAGAARPDTLTHGTTVATNTVLERNGAVVALVTTEGFADVIEIARQDRPCLYDQHVDRPEPLVSRDLRYEVAGRLDARGIEIMPVDLTSLTDIDDRVETVAVCLLHSDLDPSHERAVTAQLASMGFDVTASYDLSPEYREYERISTAVVNSYVRPACRSYLAELAGLAQEVLVMTSAGGLVPLGGAMDHPATMLLSGPAGGVAAGAAVAVANGYPDAITFDMGGTSTDVCLVLAGEPEPASERVVAGIPVRLPSLDVHTIGAGGGSIAHIDDGGALKVGPRSAGAVPGPACYGLGGELPTVTDADLVLGRFGVAPELPGIGLLDVGSAKRALDRAGVDAEGVVAVAEAQMHHALRRVSVERGVDPRGLALVAFGGAGPLHACALAEALDMAAVIIPARAGVFSAVGILSAPRQVDLVRSWPDPGDHAGAQMAAEELADLARERLSAQMGAGDHGDIEVSRWFDCRYAGQSHELRVSDIASFHEIHRRRNGYSRADGEVEVVAVRARATCASAIRADRLAVLDREREIGPGVTAEADCTIWVPPGWWGELGAAGAYVLRRSPG